MNLILKTTFFLCLIGVVFPVYSQEICDNAIDDDGDGLVDLNDNECDCDNLINLSVIPNPSFEESLCCPETEAMLVCANDWVQASDATSDYYNLCGLSELMLDGAIPPLEPLPGGGDGFIGLYNFSTPYREYVGVCTEDLLLAGISYTLTFHTAYAYGDEDELLLEIYGTPNCMDLPWTGVTCPEGIDSWQLLAAENITYSMDGAWQVVSVTFTPLVNLEAIAFGGTCGDIGDTDGSYFYFDELILNESFLLGEIETTGGWCSGDLQLTANTIDDGGYWQWFKNGEALPGETDPTINPISYGEGEFTAVYFYDEGCKRVSYQSPTIPVADFDFVNVCFGDEVYFENLSTGVGDSGLVWGFDDTNISLLFDPVHLYEAPGTYEVELIVFSEDESCYDTTMHEVSIFPRPEADFEIESIGSLDGGTNWVVCANHSLNFNDLTSIDGAPSFDLWSWEFGDGGMSNVQNPTHIYTEPGVYNLHFLVRSEAGCIDSVSKQIYVNQITADYAVEDACIGEMVQFVNNSFTSDESSIINSLWDFGDASDELNIYDATHEYLTAGEFVVSLKVENTQGCRDTLVRLLTIRNLPSVEFYVDRTVTHYFESKFRFSISYPEESSNYYWDFPLGSPLTSESDTYVDVNYPEFETGEYTVYLSVEDEFGCINKDSLAVLVLEDDYVIAPNSFTPDQDGINDDWSVYVSGFNLDEFYLQVYNRWGEVVWETRNPEEKWNGNGPNNTVVQDGVYTWYLKARDLIDDRVFEHTGFIVVFR
ncbi:PKD domain-containing protein [Crocinitomix algicola]|uniref:PKD domain-containing protein n=1 Tax=Crocinitomix algicola TaxID=1740263 RepID=UPI000872AB0E|nr:PKD domain-containing protein [Crocinitomix algicola]